MPALAKRQHLFAVAAVGRHERGDAAVIGESLQRRFRHGVDRERRGEGLDVEHVGALGSLVPVLAQSSRCGRAPKLNARCQRGEASSSRYAL